MMRHKGFLKGKLIMVSVLILSLAYPVHAQDWKTCIRTSVGAANSIVPLGILSPAPCPPGVGGDCWKRGPNWSQFTFGNKNRIGPCLNATYPASECRGWKGKIEVCGVSAVFLQGPGFEYIHSDRPPTVLYMKMETRPIPPILGILTGDWKGRHKVWRIEQNDKLLEVSVAGRGPFKGKVTGPDTIEVDFHDDPNARDHPGTITNNGRTIEWQNGTSFERQ